MTLDVTHTHDDGLAYPELRPTPQLLQLLLRAAVVDDGHGGPWLSVVRSHTSGGVPVYQHHIHMHPVDLHSTRRLVLLSGDEALSYAMGQRLDLVHLNTGQLRRLGTYACELHDAPGWNQHYLSWHERWVAAKLQRTEHWDLCRGDARALRWGEAEKWLARPQEG